MRYNCMNIVKWTEAQLKYTYDVSLTEATPQELHEALGQSVMMAIADNWSTSKKTRMQDRKAYYISAESMEPPIRWYNARSKLRVSPLKDWSSRQYYLLV